MKLFFLGDIVGRAGRECVTKILPELVSRYAIDCVIANVDNAAHGIGVTPAIVEELCAAGVHICTGGNHIWDRKEGRLALECYPQLLRPFNHLISLPGSGIYLHSLPDGRKLIVLHLLGSLFMNVPVTSPFLAADEALEPYTLGKNVAGVFVDFHAEAASEKMALAYYLNGRVSAVVGTHTHIPTSDTFILSKGTAYQTDAGMCGSFSSVIGMLPEAAIDRFLRPYRAVSLSPAEGEATLCGTLIDVEDSSGKALSIFPVQLGGVLPTLQPH